MLGRRAFLKNLLGRLLVICGLAFLAYPILSFMTYRKSRTKKVIFHPKETAAAVNYKEGVFLVRREGETLALSARCTHLGCTLSYDAVSGKFRCPCHGSVFALSGERLEGPARASLQPAPLKKQEDGDMVVTLSV
jgi:cytochrome b6-f complex iron-sulfur subunit